MTEDILASLKAIDLAILREVVQQDQGNPSFKISEWSVRHLSSQGLMNPDGLWLFSGQGSDHQGSRPWFVVLKILERQEQVRPLSDRWHWQREFFLAQSGLTKRMPGPVNAPHFYRVEEHADSAWIWMEHVESHRPSPWVLDDYVFAARLLGTWNGAIVKEMPPLTEPWLVLQPYRSFFSQSNREQEWQFLLHQKYISTDTRNRCERLWVEREMFSSAMEALPQYFSHFDSQRRNLFIRRGMDDQDELVTVDWAQCGLGPLGAELSSLVGWSSVFLEWPTTALPELDRAAFGSYIQGLHQAGWTGDVDMVRLGYLAWLAMMLGANYPGIMAWFCSADNRQFASKTFGLVEEELYLQLLPGFFYSLDCADKARLLMRELAV